MDKNSRTSRGRPQRIAVVGSGIAGLGAAWLLSRAHQVTLFERDARLGGHSNTIEVDDHGRRLAIDTGFIVYNELNYPHLTGMFAVLGVPTKASDMSFAASVEGVEYAGDSLAALFVQRRRLLDPVHWRMLVDIARFNRDAKRALAGEASGALGAQTLGEYLDAAGYGRALRERYLLPMGGAIWSCPTRTMLGFPAASFLRFLDNHRLLDLGGRPQWRTVDGGAREYLRRALDSAKQNLFPLTVQRGTPVLRVLRDAGGVELKVGGGQRLRFDHVVLACHAPESLALLADASGPEAELLGAFRYQRNRAVLHRDPRLMPAARRAWSSWNYRAAPAAVDGADTRVAVTYWMNRLQRLPTQTDWFVSLNPVVEPAAETIAFSCEYEHPVFSAAAIRAQRGLDRVQGRGGVWFAGAWTGYGFHEDGLRSAVAIAEAFGVAAPWAASSDPAGAAAPDARQVVRA